MLTMGVLSAAPSCNVTISFDLIELLLAPFVSAESPS